ncbi:hypothetical protein CPB83DRAFT_881309 [Crepidotus variabilis]|uniref:RBR-type E3 ubiquitin transferase n=1 Tax=Crepidotus variabilis TaxID=179855 RepID=A0A9P6EKY7_9AGAR|nr:hypothetical protein CPB83DRAFT_881309 [Crepidotus variabilis]
MATVEDLRQDLSFVLQWLDQYQPQTEIQDGASPGISKGIPSRSSTSKTTLRKASYDNDDLTLLILQWSQDVVRFQEPQHLHDPPRFHDPLTLSLSKDLPPIPLSSIMESPIEEKPDLPISACCICLDGFTSPDYFQIPFCEHTFCKVCLLTYVVGKLDERQFPITCPMCTTESKQILITEDVLEELELSEHDKDNLLESQLLQYSVPITCPHCKHTMRVDRTEYASEGLVSCPLPRCGYRWCKSCEKEAPRSEVLHRCKDKKLDKLARKKGWKYCPGCGVLVEKTVGCNHMACGAPGCQMHFCYVCGDVIIDGKNGADLTQAITDHYARCCGEQHVEYHRSRWCSIQ